LHLELKFSLGRGGVVLIWHDSTCKNWLVVKTNILTSLKYVYLNKQ
jgi:hypothetical protein